MTMMLLLHRRNLKYMLQTETDDKAIRFLRNTDEDHVEKVEISKDYWDPQRKLGVATHFSEIISLETRTKRLISAFFCKTKTGFFTNFLRICLFMQKSKHIYKVH